MHCTDTFLECVADWLLAIHWSPGMQGVATAPNAIEKLHQGPPREAGICRRMFFICFTSLFWQRCGTPVGIDHLVVYGLKQVCGCSMSITWSHLGTAAAETPKYPCCGMLLASFAWFIALIIYGDIFMGLAHELLLLLLQKSHLLFCSLSCYVVSRLCRFGYYA